MKADETGKSTASKAASIFKNPFDVEKDQLIRQLFELPARMAAIVQSRRDQLGNGNGYKTESPFSISASKLTAREDMGARQSASAKTVDFNQTNLKQFSLRDPSIDDMDWSSSNLLCRKKIGCATKAREDNIKEPATYGRGKRKRIEHSQAASSNSEYISKGSGDGCLCIDTTSQIKLGELDAEFQKSCRTLPMSANDEVFSNKEDEMLVEKSVTMQKQAGIAGDSQAAKQTPPVAGQDKVVPVLPPSKMKMKPHDVAKFIIMVIRTLRHTSESNMQKLFEILSVPDFPVEKCSFLEELIQQAQHYNKEGVAEQLGKYRSQIMPTRMSDSQNKG